MKSKSTARRSSAAKTTLRHTSRLAPCASTCAPNTACADDCAVLQVPEPSPDQPRPSVPDMRDLSSNESEIEVPACAAGAGDRAGGGSADVMDIRDDGKARPCPSIAETRQAFYQRIGYVPGPDQRYVRPVDDLSLDYYHRLLR